MNLLRPKDLTLNVNNHNIHLLDWGGEGRTPLLLLHGFSGHAHAWDTLSIALQPHYRVIAMDQRGHGDSDPSDEYGADATASDVLAVLDQLKLDKIVLIGLSMGGRNAMRFAGLHPERLTKLVILDIGPEVSRRAAAAPAGPPEPDTWNSIEQAARHLYRGNPYPGIHYYRWVAATSLRQRDDGSLVWAWHPSIKQPRSQAEIDWWDVLRSIKVPTLVLRGEESPVLDRDVAEKMAKELPNGRFVEIPQAVHTLHEDNPEAVLAALSEFLGFDTTAV
jgi:pimeloyl-ACP methyl ester carboxylesterase